MTTNRSAKELRDKITYCSNILVACALMVWGIFNISTNVQIYRKSEEEGMDWGIALGFIVVTSVIPFLVGIWMLFRVTATKYQLPKR